MTSISSHLASGVPLAEGYIYNITVNVLEGGSPYIWKIMTPNKSG